MRVLRYRPATKDITSFAEAAEPVPTDWTAGLRRPLDIRIASDSASLLIADYGALGNGKHLKAVKGSGVIWKITPSIQSRDTLQRVPSGGSLTSIYLRLGNRSDRDLLVCGRRHS